MPAIEDINRIKQVINSLANEPAVLAERGESLEDVKPPESGLDAELSSLLDMDDDTTETETQETAAPDSFGGDLWGDDEEDSLLMNIPLPEDETTPVSMDAFDEGSPDINSEPDADLSDLFQQKETGGSETPQTSDGFDLAGEDFSLDLPEEPEVGIEEGEGAEGDSNLFDIPEAFPDIPSDEGELNSLDDLDLGDAGLGNPDFEIPGEDESYSEPSFDLPEESVETDIPDSPADGGFDLDGLDASDGESDPLSDDIFSLDDLGDSGDIEDTGETEPDLTAEALGFDAVSDDGLPDFSDDGLGNIEEFNLDDLGDITEEVPASDSPADEGSFLNAEDFVSEEKNEETLPDDTPPPAEDEAETGGDLLDELDDLGGLDDLDGLDDLGGLDDLEDFGDLGEAVDVEEIPADDIDIPDMDEKLAGLSEQADSSREDELAFDTELNMEDEIGEEVLDEMLEDEPDTQQFSLDDFGDEFNLDDTSAVIGDELTELEKSISDQESEEKEEEFSVDDEEFLAIRRTLSSLPQNLKIAVEEKLADEGFEGEKFTQLVNALINGQSPKAIASLYHKLVGRKISLPRGYEKQAGINFEDKKQGFVYQFKKIGWPFLRVFVPVLILVWLLFLGGFQFIYRPLAASSYYKKGYEELLDDNYDQADDYFNLALFGWKVGPLDIEGIKSKKWFYQYGESYIDRRAYRRASKKYAELITIFPYDYKGMFDYGNHLSLNMAEYKKSEEIFKLMLGKYKNDYETLLALGDNYMRWAEEEPVHWEDVRYTYATLLEKKGGRDELILRQLNYFMKTGKDQEVYPLHLLIKDKESWYSDPSFTAEILSDLGGFFLDRDDLSNARQMLNMANVVDDTVPNVHYQLARFFHIYQDDIMEEKALYNTLFYLQKEEVLDKHQLIQMIDVRKRYGDLRVKQYDYEKAEKEYLHAISLFESGAGRNLIGTFDAIGELYASTADLYYYNYNDYRSAFNYFLKAEENNYYDYRIDFKKGFVYYNEYNNYAEALASFYNSYRQDQDNRNIQYSLANTMIQRGDYYGAVGLYQNIVSSLKEDEKAIDPLLHQEKDEHLSFLQYSVRTHNNLGVAYYMIDQRSHNPEAYDMALASFTEASRYYDLLMRDPETMAKAAARDIGYENRMTIIGQRDDAEPLLMNAIPYDTSVLIYEDDNF